MKKNAKGGYVRRIFAFHLNYSLYGYFHCMYMCFTTTAWMGWLSSNWLNVSFYCCHAMGLRNAVVRPPRRSWFAMEIEIRLEWVVNDAQLLNSTTDI